MATNRSSMARRQRERKRQQKRREKQLEREERRLQKKEAEPTEIPDDPLKDPTIDWGAAVREGDNIAINAVEEEETEDGEEELEEETA